MDENEYTNRNLKEKLLDQRSKVIWLTGLSGAGKTTIALALENKLFSAGYLSQILDGDIIRNGINKNLGFSNDDRTENIRRIAEVSKLFLDCGIITINGFISPTKKIRELARNIVGKEDFLEIYINSSLEICEKRDIKGLYKKAREGKISDFTGIGSAYEPPENPFLEINTGTLTINESVDMLFDAVLPLIQLKFRSNP